MDDSRFWWFHADENNRRDIANSVDDLIPIVDEEAGGIIAYALSPDHANKITAALNQSVSRG